jgi:hypothetical protein
MSPRSRTAAAGLLGLAALSLLAPLPASGHAIGQVFTLPIPLALYLAAAGVAVAASFVVSVIVVKPAGDVPNYPVRVVDEGLARRASLALQVVGLLWWLAIIWLGLTLDPISPLPAVLFWIGIWVALPIAAVLLGNPWPSLSPFRTLFGLLERGAGGLGVERLDAGVRYPAWLGRWAATGLLFVALWCELVLPDSEGPRVIAGLVLSYTALTLAGMAVFGRVAWLRNAELFEVLLGWFGRAGPIGRRVVVPTVCDGCSDGCNPERCVDCPECAATAEPGERRAELRPWFAGLTEVRRAGWADAAFIVLALAGVTFDGLRETTFYGSLTQPVFQAMWDVLGPLRAVLAVQTGGLLAVWLVFMAAFAAAAWLTRALHSTPRELPLGASAGPYAASLLPIAGGYLVAHYLTLVIQSVVWLPELVADPIIPVAPTLDWIPISAVWYLSVGAIVVGHIVAIVLAHRQALRESPGRAVLAGLPLVVLMVAYTVLSLWIIAAPITVDPGQVIPEV